VKVTITALETNVDDRGELCELLRTDDHDFEQFGQVYCVLSRQPGIVRAWHRHQYLYDWFIIVSGAAKFGFVDALPNDKPEGAAYYITTSERKLTRICVPPGVWHGWMALVPNTLLISVASQLYKGPGRCLAVDEERLPADSFNAEWYVKAR
jgi:dTDP-4-dehydrorhamnose 3,5-epimerase